MLPRRTLLYCSRRRLPPVGTRARLCASKLPAASKPKQPQVVTSTLLFRAGNPELYLDPQKRTSWLWPALVVAFFSTYLGYFYLIEEPDILFPDPNRPIEETAAALPANVVKVLPDGSQLLDDGSIRRQS